MSLNQFLQKVKLSPESLTFKEVSDTINLHYEVQDVAFSNGQQHNAKGENAGSCKIFSFALLHKLNKQQTLDLFAEFYRNDVLMNPEGKDHQNIRQFMQHGFAGLSFEDQSLYKKTT